MDREIYYVDQRRDIEHVSLVQCHVINHISVDIRKCPTDSHVFYVFSHVAAGPIEPVENRRNIKM